MTELPTGTIMFLFTDIEGSTRLLQELGDAYGAVQDDLPRSVCSPRPAPNPGAGLRDPPVANQAGSSTAIGLHSRRRCSFFKLGFGCGQTCPRIGSGREVSSHARP